MSRGKFLMQVEDQQKQCSIIAERKIRHTHTRRVTYPHKLQTHKQKLARVNIDKK